MTYTAVKEKLHDYIETGDQKKVKALYALIEDDYKYDEATLDAWEKISDDAFAGRIETLTVEESMASIKKSRKNNAL